MAKVIKKTMEAPLAYITALGLLSVGQIEEFTNKFCYTADSSTSTGPREVTILKDGEEVVGRKCMVCEVFFPIDRFAKGTTVIKEVDAVRGKFYNESKKMEKDAQSILDEARDITDVNDKVAKFEEYDSKLAEAKAHRTQSVVIEADWLEGSFPTIEDLAANLGVAYPQDAE